MGKLKVLTRKTPQLTINWGAETISDKKNYRPFLG